MKYTSVINENTFTFTLCNSSARAETILLVLKHLFPWASSKMLSQKNTLWAKDAIIYYTILEVIDFLCFRVTKNTVIYISLYIIKVFNTIEKFLMRTSLNVHSCNVLMLKGKKIWLLNQLKAVLSWGKKQFCSSIRLDPSCGNFTLSDPLRAEWVLWWYLHILPNTGIWT